MTDVATISLPGSAKLFQFGAEREPVIVIDDFAKDPEALIREASTLRFEPRGIHYPGIRAPLRPTYLAARMEVLETVLRNGFGLNRGANLAEAAFSLVTTQPENLTPIQTLPHFDTTDPERLALLHYLHGPEQGGTAFYRHRTTGFETVSQERLPAYDEALREDVKREGLPRGYVRGSTSLFEQIGAVPAAFNRMVIYRSRTLHSGHIPEDFSFSPQPDSGRLTVNIFLQGR